MMYQHTLTEVQTNTKATDTNESPNDDTPNEPNLLHLNYHDVFLRLSVLTLQEVSNACVTTSSITLTAYRNSTCFRSDIKYLWLRSPCFPRQTKISETESTLKHLPHYASSSLVNTSETSLLFAPLNNITELDSHNAVYEA